MKLLFDQNLSHKLCDRLADIFPESSHVRLCNLDRAGDRQIWQYAKDYEYALVTLDADFADTATLYGAPPFIVWLRCGNQPTRVVEGLLRENAMSILELETDSSASCIELYLVRPGHRSTEI